MIFVTVGTHEQNFDRLVKEVDNLVKENVIKEEVFIQTGYSNYVPKYCKYEAVISYDEMERLTKTARIVITHGGPGSIFLPIQYMKKPIVVPRNPKFDEHVDNHQILFAKRMFNNDRVDLVLDIGDLKDKILNYQGYENGSYSSNQKLFINRFGEYIDSIFME
ncbi:MULTISPECIES: glycosyltransferase [Clostridium]|uniref:glycosyltransferase n=1 Tax=Clostridium TaxID=1485 RepID=UPI000C069BFB|nr:MULTISPECIES: glycosyltransferase [Clostridium]MBS4958719.1 glycosyl transferase family 28 [Clostridium sp.]MBS5306148.1 glycosyl transferase family 28 [Clostridium sp.]MDB1941163.1 glycosyltransferase [Clostridium tertium]MDU2157223.1 glycosyltransferase [Clostridium sp.]MDU3350590.1 glycosyltransferase [Clostridium sp.]